MPTCLTHKKFELKAGTYYRAADPSRKTDWIPKNPEKAAKYYKIACSDDLTAMAAIMGEAQMVHSGESSDNSPFISVALCPLCLRESKDPTVAAIVDGRGYFCQIILPRKNESKYPYVFHMSGEGVGAGETECLVLMPPGEPLSTYVKGYVTPGYLDSMV